MSNKFYVVCDANGECKGLFIDENMAIQAANYYGAFVSEEVPQTELPSEVTDWIKLSNGE